MAECCRHPGNVLPGCCYCRYGIEPEVAGKPEPATLGDLLLAANFDAGKSAMLRVHGQVFACALPSIVFHEGTYVLMLDGECRG